MRRYLSIALLATLGGLPLAAQERADSVWRSDLPPEVAREVTDFFNDPRTIHFTARTRIPAERVVDGDVAVLGGPFSVAGQIRGRVVVINGDVELLRGASISGGLTVVGGSVWGLADAKVGGEVVTYSERLRYRWGDGERIVLTERQRRRAPEGQGPGRDQDARGGRSDFLITTGQSYNRVEGLPITFGPRIETAGSNPLRVRALAIYRTEAGWTLNTDRLGYHVSAEQFLGGRRSLRVGGTVHSVIDPIEGWHLSDLENGLSTFLFHRDYRDHYEKEGWSAFTTWEPRRSRTSLTAEFRSEVHRSLPAGSPFTLFNNSERWRAQPLVGEGHLQSVALRGRYDTRSQTHDPSSGWLVQGEVERGLDAGLSLPPAVAVLEGTSLPFPGRSYGTFTHGVVDVRRYNRISPDSRLNFRLLTGGALGGGALPPQRQHALGGEGSLPGYTLFSLDCAARSSIVYRAEELPTPDRVAAGDARAYFPAYGCDRFTLFQAEYRGQFAFRFDWRCDPRDEDHGAEDWEDWIPEWDSSLNWVAFWDAGRGWGAGERPDEPLAMNLGLGVLIQRFGIYAAVPLTGRGGVNLFVRIGPRF